MSGSALVVSAKEMTSVAVYGQSGCLSSYTKHVFQIGDMYFLKVSLLSTIVWYFRAIHWNRAYQAVK